ncbi:MAG: T9SS type A sorting domain-containing protein [Bacteroidia bacterium]
MKNTFRNGLLTLALMIAALPAMAQFTGSMPVIQATPGQQVEIPILVQQMTGVEAFNIGIRFNTSVLTYQNTNVSGTLMNGQLFFANLNGNQLEMSYVGSPVNATNDTLVKLVFTYAAGGGQSQLIWNPVYTEFTGANSTNLAATLTNGVLVEAGTTTEVSATNGNVSGCELSTVNFNVTSTGSSFQWQRSTDGGTTFVNMADGSGISGATSASLSVSNVSQANTGEYFQCVVGGAGGTTLSPAQRLTVNAITGVSVTVTAAPSGAVCTGSLLSFSATPNPVVNNPVYTWRINGVVAGSNDTLQRSNLNDGDQVSCEISSSTECVSGSGDVTVSIVSLPTAFNLTGGGSFCAGDSGVVVGLSGSQNGVNYQLLRDGQAVGAVLAGTGAALDFGLQTQAGAYTVSAENTTGCTNTMSGSATVSINALPNANAGADTSVFIGNSVQLQATGGTSYSWSPATGLSATNIANPVASPTETTTYTVTVSNIFGCLATDSLVVTVNQLPVVDAGNDTAVCIDAQAFNLSGSPSGGSWSGNGISSASNGTFNPATAGAGSWDVVYTVSDGQNYTISDTLVVTVNALPVVSFVNPGNLCINDQLLSLTTATPAGGTYSGPGVSNGQFDPAAVGGGIYTLFYAYTDSVTGCSNIDSATIEVNSLPNVTLAAFGDLCEGAAAFSLTGGLPAGGTYEGSFVSNGMFDPVAAGPGTHSIAYIYTDPITGCTDTASADITVNSLPVIDFPVLAPACINSGPVSLNTATPAGGTYSGPGVNNNQFFPAQVGLGTYVIVYTFTDTATGCTATDSSSITVNDPPAVTLDSLVPVCLGSPAFALTGGLPAGGTYSGPGVSNNMFDANVAGTGTHPITYTYIDSLTGCEGSFTRNIVVGDGPNTQLNALGATTFCMGGSVVLEASPVSDLNYVWLLNGVVMAGETGGTLTATMSGSYRVIGTVMATGCFDTSAAVSVTVNPLPGAAITPAGSTSLCSGNFVQLNASPLGGFSYSWLLDGAATGQAGESLTVNAAGNYQVVVTDTTTGCFDTSAVVAIVVNTPPAAGLTAAGATTFCAGSSVLLNATPASGMNYSWLLDGALIGGQTAASLSASQSGAYRVIVTDSATGCFDTSAAVSITVNPLPVAGLIAAGPTSFCTGGSVVLNATPTSGVTYAWLRDGAPVAGQTAASLTASQAGAYRVIVTDSLTACFDTSAAVTVTVNAAPTAGLTAAGPTTFCAGGSVVLNATPATGVTYAWLRDGAPVAGQTASSLTATQAGAYRVIVTNTSTCFDTSAAVTVVVNAAPTAGLTAAGPTTFCAGGSVVLNASPATGVTYAWLRDGAPVAGQTGASLTASLAGAYRVIVTNTSSCSDTSSVVTVTVNAAPTAGLTAAGPTSFCAGGSVVLNATPATGVTYVWLRDGAVIAGQTASSLTATQAGAYRVRVQNTSGCFDTSSVVTVTVNANPTAGLTAVGPTTICQGGSVVLNAAPTTGVTYVWLRDGVVIAGQTANSLTATQAGAYRVRVENTSGCFDTSAAVTVVVNPRPNAPTITVSATSDTLFSSAAAGNQWFRNGVAVAGATGQTLVITQNGTYRALVTDANSCVSDSSNALNITNVSTRDMFNLSLNLYPNPTTGRSWVELDLPGVGHLELEVMNTTGQRVLYELHRNASGTVQLEIDLKQMADGMYFVRLTQGNHTGMRKLLVRH